MRVERLFAPVQPLLGGSRDGVGQLGITDGSREHDRADQADLVVFGRSLPSNPDLAARIKANAALNPPDKLAFYRP